MFWFFAISLFFRKTTVFRLKFVIIFLFLLNYAEESHIIF